MRSGPGVVMALGAAYVPPPCTGVFPDVECTPTPAFAVNWIEELFNEGITGIIARRAQ